MRQQTDNTRAEIVALLGPSRQAVSGVSTHLNQLFGSDLARRYDLRHFLIGSEGRREGRLQAIARYIFSPLALFAYLLRVRPGLVHLNSSLEQKAFWRDAVYMLVAKAVGRRVVFQVHGGALPKDFAGGSAVVRRLVRHLLEMPDAVVLLASIEQRAYRAFASLPRLEVIPNAIELEDYGHIPPKRFDGHRLRGVYMGRLADDKGIFEALEAVRILRDAGMDPITFDIAGSGPCDEELRERVCAYGLQDVVTFRGAVFGEDKLRFWGEADLFLFPTYHDEGLPYVVLESLASRTPMITTAVGAIPDVIRDGEHGLIVAPKDPPAVADAIRALAGDRDRLRQMSAAGRARAEDEYSVARMAGAFAQLYATVLG